MSTRLVTLGEVCTARSSLVSPTQPENLQLPHIAPDNIERDTGRLLAYRTVAEDGVASGKYRFEAGDLLYSKIRPNLNKLTVVDFPGLCSADMYALRVDETQIAIEFLAHLLRGRQFLDFATSLSNRANIPKLNRAQLLGFTFELPPLDEQRRIATILDEADALRVKRRRVLELLENLKESLFLDMFGDGGNELGTVAETAIVQGGLQVTSARKSLPVEVNYLRVANVFRGRLDLGEVKTLRVTEAELERTRLRAGDVLVVEGHGNPSEVGRAAAWTGEIPTCVHQNHLIRVRFDSSQVLPEFGVAWLNSHAGRQHLLRAAKTTSGLNTISASNVKSAPVPLVPIADQRRFALRVGQTSRLSSVCEGGARDLDELFQALRERAFAGLL